MLPPWQWRRQLSRRKPRAQNAGLPRVKQGSSPMNDNVDITNGSQTARNSRSLSAQQRRFWVLEQLEHSPASHHTPICLRIRGKLDTTRLEDATALVHAKHDALRSC